MFLLTYISFSILCIIEAYLEQAVIKLKSEAVENYNYWNAEEHKRSAIYYFAILAYALIQDVKHLPFAWNLIYLVPLVTVTLMVIRRIFFDGALRVFRKRKLSLIEGTGMVDNFSRRIFGVNGGIKELGLLVTFAIVLFFITL